MYLSVDEIVTRCELLAEQFPDEVTLATLPEPTHENRPMLLLRITAGRTAPRHGLYIQANIHVYREFMRPVDQARFATYAARQREAIFAVAGTGYATGTSFLEMYGMSGNANDYAYSRHLADPARGKVDGYIYEFQQRGDVPFQPPFEEPPGPNDMLHVIRDVAAGLTALLIDVDRIPIADCAPPTLDFGRVRVGTSRQRSITVTNRGIRAFDIGTVSMLGGASPFALAAPSQSHLDPGEHATIPVTVAPTAAVAASSRVAIEFAFADESVRDVRIVPCMATGCTVGAEACVAPTFGRAGWLTCLLRSIVYGAIVVALALPALFSAELRCTVKQLLFRIRHCGDGNQDPCRVL